MLALAMGFRLRVDVDVEQGQTGGHGLRGHSGQVDAVQAPLRAFLARAQATALYSTSAAGPRSAGPPGARHS